MALSFELGVCTPSVKAGNSELTTLAVTMVRTISTAPARDNA